MLTTNLRTHYVILQDGRKFPITYEQYNNIRELKTSEKATSFFTLTDIDTRKVLFDGELRSIKEFQEVSKKRNDVKWYFCWYGNTHGMNDKCDCRDKYKVSEASFRSEAYRRFWKYDDKIVETEDGNIVLRQYHMMYMQDLAYKQRNEIVDSLV